jgi:glycosyltransferase involved in cell wall biosynthesis
VSGDNKVKVALTYDSFPHYRNAILEELCTNSEHRFVLAADSRSTVPSIMTGKIPPGVEHVLCSCVSVPGGPTFQRGLIGLALRRDLDAIIYLGCPELASTWLSAVTARLTGKRVLFWTHGWTRRDPLVRGVVKRMFYRLANALLLYGNIAKRIGMEYGFSSEKLHVIYNSLNYQEQARIRDAFSREQEAQCRRDLFVKSDLPMVICTARLIAACRFDLLLEAGRLLIASGHPINILLVGDGPERASLEAACEGALRPYVRFYGQCYDEPTLGRLIMAADVTVSPGKVGLTAMHSMAYGTPVISHDNIDNQMPEVEAIVPGVTGELFAEGDAVALADSIRRWTGLGISRASIRSGCIQVIEQFYNPQYQRQIIDRAINGEAAAPMTTLSEVGCVCLAIDGLGTKPT